MVDPGRRPLAGWLEVDESAIDYRTKEDPVAGGQGRGHDGKWAVIGAVEVIDDHPGRIRLATIADYSADSLDDFIKANVGAAATAKTDGWSGYPGVPEVDHDPHVIGPMAAHIVLPWIHWVFSNLKNGRWGSITACAESTCKPISTSSSSDSTAAARDKRHSDACSDWASSSARQPTTC